MATSSRRVSNAVLYLRMLQALRASLLAKATASLLQLIRSAARVSQLPKLKSGQVAEIQIRIAFLNRKTALGVPITEPVG